MNKDNPFPMYSAFVRAVDGEKPLEKMEKQGFLQQIAFPTTFGKVTENSSSASTEAETPSVSDAEDNGLFSMVKKGMEKASGSVVAATSGVRQQAEDASFFLSSQRLPVFLFFSGIGVIFMFLAFLFLPMIVFSPQKFALFFSFGSASFIVSLGAVKGVRPLVKHVTTKDRIPFSVAYFASLFLTLYAALFAKSYILTLFAAVIQLVTLLSLLLSYVPGGKKLLGVVKDKIFGVAKFSLPI